ncbi:MAG: YbaB/EbfC family nucleoid-associated protein [Clostridia bacterium]|jgi:nucleoid-associated protein EbfC|nr:YbaB/EbfC family nucleoid-associated protein [Clostridia bacterium]NLS84420.1 YbaB/EbfC family nucleoid-associated protein [Oscillospiraceae bacterium]
MKARLPQGYGKQNMNQLMQQAQQVQENMKAKQAELEETEYSVTSGGGMVEITMKGTHQVTKLKINPDVVQPDDIEMLEDLVAAAVNEAVRVVDEAGEAEMGALTNGLNIPGL